MNDKNLIIYKFNSLYRILEELSLILNFNIICVESENHLGDITVKLDHFLIISNKKYKNIGYHFILENLPISIFKLIEKINIELLKFQFNSQSQFKVKNYTINLNSREMFVNDAKLKLTEKEINTIIYLSKIKNPVNIDELQRKVWGYHSDIETHTVETHIYRLRKKMFKIFNDENFLISKKNGYQIK